MYLSSLLISSMDDINNDDGHICPITKVFKILSIMEFYTNMFSVINKNLIYPMAYYSCSLDDSIRKMIYDTHLRADSYISNVYICECWNTFQPSYIYYVKENNIIRCSCVGTPETTVMCEYHFDSRGILSLKYFDIESGFSNNNYVDRANCTSNCTSDYISDYTSDCTSDYKNDWNETKPITTSMMVTNTDSKNVFVNTTNMSENMSENITVGTLDNVTNSTNEAKIKEFIESYESLSKLMGEEVFRIKRLEHELKSNAKKIRELEKKKFDTTINNIIQTQTEYRTWKRMKYVIDEESDLLEPIEDLVQYQTGSVDIPIMFLSKYKYLDRVQENHNVSQMFEKINNIDLNELFMGNETVINYVKSNDALVQFAERYVKLSKELNYEFEHEWDYLEGEMNCNATNSM